MNGPFPRRRWPPPSLPERLKNATFKPPHIQADGRNILLTCSEFNARIEPGGLCDGGAGRLCPTRSLFSITRRTYLRTRRPSRAISWRSWPIRMSLNQSAKPGPHSTGISAIWFDYDRDGKRDLFLGGYYSEDIDLWHLKTTRIMPESFEYARNGGRKVPVSHLGC
jgi:hypothetical protein